MAEPVRRRQRSKFLKHLFEGLAALAALATIIGVYLQLRGDDPPPAQMASTENPAQSASNAQALAPPSAEDQSGGAPLSERADDSDTSAARALDEIAKEEWCYVGLSALLRRVLRSAPRASLEELADAGDARAQLLVGRGHVDALFGFPLAPETAFSFFKRAASGGDPSALNALGVAYDLGIGIEADPYAAVPLYKRASDAGCAQATHNLALAYGTGSGGLTQDREEAIRLHRVAAAQGLDSARQSLEWYRQNP